MKEMQICNRCLINKDPVPPGKAHAGCGVTPDTKKAADKHSRIRYHACNEEECLESFILCGSPVHMTKNQVKLNKCKEKWKDRDVQFSVNLVKVQSNLSGNKRSIKKKTKMFDFNTEIEVGGFDINTNEDVEALGANNKRDMEVFENCSNNEDEGEYQLKGSYRKIKASC